MSAARLTSRSDAHITALLTFVAAAGALATEAPDTIAPAAGETGRGAVGTGILADPAAAVPAMPAFSACARFSSTAGLSRRAFFDICKGYHHCKQSKEGIICLNSEI